MVRSGARSSKTSGLVVIPHPDAFTPNNSRQKSSKAEFGAILGYTRLQARQYHFQSLGLSDFPRNPSGAD